MKTSIKKLLSSVEFNIVVTLLFTVVTGLMLLSSYATHQRVMNIDIQEQLVKKSMLLDHKDLQLAQIASKGISRRLSILIDDMASEPFYELPNALVFKQKDYQKRLFETLRRRAAILDDAMKAYFFSDTHLMAKRRNLQTAVNDYLAALQKVTLLQAKTLERYLGAAGIGLGLIALWLLLVLMQAKRASAYILGDIRTVLQQDNAVRSQTKLTTTEMNSISLKLRNENSDAIAPSKQDPVTQLPNYEGIKSAFDRRPITSKNLTIAVCIFEIDNYSKLANHYPQSVIDPVLVKIASIMKLHKMTNDHVGRIDENQFIAIFVRPEKKKAFEECDHIRQMIEEHHFKLPHNALHITVSGGFTVKTPSQTLDDAVKNAKEYLQVAHEKGGNVIAEVKNTQKIL